MCIYYLIIYEIKWFMDKNKYNTVILQNKYKKVNEQFKF